MPSRPHAAVDRFVLAVEQLAVARELLTSGSPAKARMAVILLDGLADALLFRRLESLYRTSEEPVTRLFNGPMYPKPLRRQARADFGVRLALCAATGDAMSTARGEGPLVQPPEHVVLAVGHSYRNAAYHRDRHNPATIGVIGKLLLRAVAELFVRSQSPGLSSSVVPEDARRLRGLAVPLERGMMQWREAAALAVTTIAAELAVELGELVSVLARDLAERLEAVDALAAALPGGERGVNELMAALEFQATHGPDPELLKQGALRDPAVSAVRLGIEVTPQLVAEAHAAETLYNQRVVELQRAWRPHATLAITREVRMACNGLTAQTDRLVVLQTYRDLDARLEMLEDQLAVAAYEFDRYVDMQIEAMRER